MDYLKIAEIAHKCEVKQKQINQLHVLVGANMHFPNEVRSDIYRTVDELRKDLDKLEGKLKKLIGD